MQVSPIQYQTKFAAHKNTLQSSNSTSSKIHPQNSQNISFGWIFEDARFYFAHRLSDRREAKKQEQFKKTEDAIHNDIQFIAARKGIPYNIAERLYQSMLDGVSIPLSGDGHEKGLNKVIGYSFEKYQVAKELLLPLIASRSYNADEYPIPNGVLLYGPQSTGKTHFVQALGEHIEYMRLADYEEIRLSHQNLADDDPTPIYEAFMKAEKIYKRTGKRQILFLDDLQYKISRQKTPNIQGVFLYLTRNCSDRGITWIGTVNNPRLMPDILYDTSRLNSDINIYQLSDAEKSAVMSYSWKSVDRFDQTNHDKMLDDYENDTRFHFYPPEMHDVADMTDTHLQENADRHSYIYDSVKVKAPVKTKDAIIQIEKYSQNAKGGEFDRVVSNMQKDEDQLYVKMKRSKGGQDYDDN